LVIRHAPTSAADAADENAISAAAAAPNTVDFKTAILVTVFLPVKLRMPANRRPMHIPNALPAGCCSLTKHQSA
jgi:hypothetical protein